MVLVGLLGLGCIALARQREHAVVQLDVQVVLLHAGQVGVHCDLRVVFLRRARKFLISRVKLIFPLARADATGLAASAARL